MKAYEIRPGADAADPLTPVTRPSPALGPREVRVRVRAASLNYRDLFVARGARDRKAPIVPLSDGAGEVVEVGAEVTRWRTGDRVAASFFPTWLDGPLSDAYHARALGGGQTDGMLAEEVVLDERSWVRLPSHLSFEQGATLPCAGLTAWHALFEAATVRPGDTVLVEGTGGVSIFALQLAKRAGARVILTSKSAAKRDRARALGADHVIDYVAEPAWGEAARAATGGRGVDVAVEVGGQGTFNQAAAALRYGGTLAMIGVLTGARGDIDLRQVFSKTLRVHGVYVGSVAMFEAFTRALEDTRLEPVIDQVFPWDRARDAYARLASGDHLGKLVITV